MNKTEIKNKMITRLNSLSSVSQTKLFTVEYKGVRLTMSSGKSAWVSKGAAKNALRNALPNAGYHKDRLAVIKELEDEGLIKYFEI